MPDMTEQSGGPPGLREQAAYFRHGGLSRRERLNRYRVLLYRVYFGLLLFVVLVGLPVVGIPSLRHRLATRVTMLKEAWSGAGRSAVPPILAKVGENTEAFPKEYEIPLQTWGKGPGMFEIGTPVFRAGGQAGAAQETPEPQAEEASAQAESDAGEATVTYQQGDTERKAYEIVLKSSESVAGLVQGKDPSLRFVKWAAARRDEDTYWVDLTFKSGSNGAEAHYIWQVTLSSGRVTPLSARARALVEQ